MAAPIRTVILPIALLAVGFHAWVAASSRAWVTPDSGEYIRLAAGIVERCDFRDQLFQFRTPGYPMFLAALFALFGPSSPDALVWIQHALAAACAVLASMTAWQLWPRRTVALFAGTLTALSLPLSGYANAALTEVPFTLAITAALFFLARSLATNRTGDLVFASLMVSGAILIKPGGQLLFIVAAAFLVTHALWTHQSRTLPRRLAAFFVPTTLLVAPIVLQNGIVHGSYELSCQSKLLWYYRTACVDLLQSSTSPAFGKVQAALDTARVERWTGPGTRSHHFGPVLNAARRAYGLNTSEASDLMSAAGKDLARENAATILKNTIVFTRRLVLTPDNAHRMVPGGQPGERGTLASDADLYAADTFLPYAILEAGDNTMLRYFPVTNETPSGAANWQAIVGWIHNHVERARLPSGWSTTPYEWMAALSCLGGLMLLVHRRNPATILLVSFAFAHIVLAAFFAGPAPRTITPIRPLLYVFLASTFVYGFIAARSVIGRLTTWLVRSTDDPNPQPQALDQPA